MEPQEPDLAGPAPSKPDKRQSNEASGTRGVDATLPAIEQWKENSAAARHWETLAFETAKGYYAAVAFLVGAAGAAIAWTNVPQALQKGAVAIFLMAALVLSLFALQALRSQRKHLLGFYTRRRELENDNPGLKLRSDEPGSGETMDAFMNGLKVAIAISVLLLVLLPFLSQRAVLRGARLSGADLSTVVGLTQADLEGACGDATTRLPHGLSVLPCQ